MTSALGFLGWIPSFDGLLPVFNRYTSGATPADFLVASMEAGLFLY